MSRTLVWCINVFTICKFCLRIGHYVFAVCFYFLFLQERFVFLFPRSLYDKKSIFVSRFYFSFFAFTFSILCKKKKKKKNMEVSTSNSKKKIV